jgi:DNA mismatch endonuclease (patch repair protein)
MAARTKPASMPRFQGLAPLSAATSRVGASNRRKNTAPEILLRKLLSSAGVRYRLHPPHVPGHPDLVIRRSRVVVFCDGDFWHGRHWAQRKIKLARGWNADYWIAKIERNRCRDRLVTRSLRLLGWRVIRVWESDLQRNPKGVTNNILDAIRRSPSG